MKKPVFSYNREGENVITGYEYTHPGKKEQEAREAGIRLAREFGKEAAQRRESIKSKVKPYLIETDDQ